MHPRLHPTVCLYIYLSLYLSLSLRLMMYVFYIHVATSRVEDGEWAAAFFAYQFMSIFFILVAAGLCYKVPNATGG